MDYILVFLLDCLFVLRFERDRRMEDGRWKRKDGKWRKYHDDCYSEGLGVVYMLLLHSFFSLFKFEVRVA